MFANFFSTFAVFALTALLAGCESQELSRRTSTSPNNGGGANDGSKAAKLLADDCIDPDLSKLGNDQTIMLCDGTITKGKLDLSLLTAANIKSGVTINGIVGTMEPSPDECSESGKTNCVVTGDFLSIDPADIDPSAIAINTAIAGIAGTKRDMKQCRNGAALSTFDIEDATNLPKTFNQGDVDTNTDEISFADRHGLQTGYAVTISNSTPANVPAPLISGSTYYVIRVDNYVIKLANSLSEANNGDAIDLSSTGGATPNTLVSRSNGAVDIWDTIDDNNNFLATAPDQSPWGATYLCDESNFEDASNATTLKPTNASVGGTDNWTQIWRDKLTGLLFTNVLYDGTGSVTWADGIKMCANLDSGDGTGKWRMPTQKELMQLYINGISKLALDGGPTDGYYWSSTTVAHSQVDAWYVNLTYGLTDFDIKHNVLGFFVICVR